jgi:hydrogenase expression/formation protein HypC
MCLAIPGKVIDIHTDADGVRMARATFGGIVKEVCLDFTPEAEVGQYILVHVGFALNIVDEEEARLTFELLRELGQLDELDSPEVSL